MVHLDVNSFVGSKTENFVVTIQILIAFFWVKKINFIIFYFFKIKNRLLEND